MSWALGYDDNWKRDVGYGVPAICDYPECNAKINRGLSYVCGSEPYGGEHGCGLFFCEAHRGLHLCDRCMLAAQPYDKKPDTREWIEWKLTDASWAQWRHENPDEVTRLNGEIAEAK